MMLAVGRTLRADVSTVNLPEEADGFAISRQTGAVCAIRTADGTVSLYPALSAKGATEGRITKQVGVQPVDVIYRPYSGQSYFIVACQGDKSVWVLDAATLNVAKTVQIADAPLSLGSALESRSPFIFYGAAEGLGCIDLRSFKDNGIILPSTAGMGGFHDVCVSADGHLVYGRAKTWSPTGRLVCAIDYPNDSSPVARRISYLHESVDAFRADPFGPLVAYDRHGNQSRDDYRAAADLPAPVSCFMVSRPLILSLDQAALRIYSYNTHKELASVTVRPEAEPGAVRNANRRNANRRNGQADVVLADEKNFKALVCLGSTVKIVDLSSLSIPNEPLLGVVFQGQSAFNPGVAGSQPFRKVNPNESVELVDPKPGMKLDGNSFVWTPTGSDIGDSEVKLRVSSGPFQRVQSFSVTVRRPEVDLPFVADESQISEDGKFVLLLGRNNTERRLPRPVPQGGADSGSQLALVDLAHRAIVARRVLPNSIRAIALSPEHAFAAAQDSDAIYMYSLKDLSDERKIFAPALVHQMLVAANRLYVAPQQGQTVAFSIPDLKPIDQNPNSEAANRFIPPGQTTLPTRTETGWMVDGVVYDSTFSHAIELRDPTGFPEASTGGFNQSFNYGQQLQAAEWGLAIQGDRVIRPPSQLIGTVHGTNPAFLRDIPAVAALRTEMSPRQSPTDPPRTTTSVQLFDLVSAAERASIVLSDEVRQNQPYGNSYPGQPGQSILAAGGHIAVLLYDKLFVLETASLDRAKFPDPPQLTCESGIKLIDPSKPTVISFSAAHLKPPVEFALDPDVKGMNIDKASGRLTIDGPALIPNATAQAAQMAAQQLTSFQPNSPPIRRTPQQAVDAFAQGPVERYAAIMGTKPDGVPMLVRMNVVAIDSEQQRVTRKLACFLCVPSQSVAAKLAAQQVEMAQRQPPMGYSTPRTGPASRPGDGTLQQQIDKLQAQIADLQKQNTELAAQNKMLKELILQQKKN